jgi:hypothetical protein
LAERSQSSFRRAVKGAGPSGRRLIDYRCKEKDAKTAENAYHAGL